MVSRNRAWADSRVSGTLLTSGTPLLTDLLVGAPTVDTLTAVRIVGGLTVYQDASSENEGRGYCDVGIGVSSREAFTVGATALPDPTQGDEYPPRGWLYAATKPLTLMLPTGGTPTAMWQIPAVFEFDLRAMRKIDKGVLFMWVEEATVSGTLVTYITGRVRVLCLT